VAQIICFHNPDEENGYLSNWYLSDFIWNEISFTFTSAEQYMMYRKATLFKDVKAASLILETTDVAAIKSLGRAVTPYIDSIWAEKKYELVRQGIYEKFKQNPDLCNKLLSTGNSILAECAVNDKVWGIGLSMHDPGRFSPDQWKGQNLLGKALLDIRQALLN